MTEKKRHHYVPITYLNGFTDALGKIFAHKKDDVRKTIHLRPSEIAFERYYYSQPMPNGGRDNNTLEDFFGTVESTWPSIVSRLRSGSDTASDHAALCVFMALMRVRVPATRDMVEASLAEKIQITLKLLDQKGMLPPKPAGLDNILNHINIAIDPHQSLHAMPALLDGFNAILSLLTLSVVHNKTNISFFTSDNPIIYFDPTTPESRILPYRVKPPPGKVELLFPVDASTAIIGRTRDDYNSKSIRTETVQHTILTDIQEVERVNRLTARFGYRFVFSQCQSHNDFIYKYASKSPVITNTGAATRKGGILMHQDWVFGTRPIKPKWDL